MGHHKNKCDTNSSFSGKYYKSQKGTCCKSSSSSSSSSSSKSKHCSSTDNSCIVVKKCKPCHKKNCDDICPSEPCHPAKVCCEHLDAVVKIESSFVFTTQSAADITGGATLVHSDLFTQGNGFFIRGRYIVAPAHLVLTPPSLLANANRYPFVSASQPGPSGIYPTQLVAASRILVTVNNVNGQGRSFVYEASLVGVDGSGDIAILCINFDSIFNSCNPCIQKKCAPYLKFGKSCKQLCGDVVYGLGCPTSRGRFGADGVVAGEVISNSYADCTGRAQAELFVASFPVFSCSSGLPVLDKHGSVVAMQTLAQVGDVTVPSTGLTLPVGPYSFGDGIVAGPSEDFMKRVILTLINGNCGKNRDQVQNVADAGLISGYLSYRKGFLGMAWCVLTGMDLTTVTVADGTDPTLAVQQVQFDTNNAFATPPKCKQVVGVRVKALAGGATYTYIDLPGGGNTGAPFPALPASPLVGTFVQDDIITHMDRKPLGNGNGCCTVPPAKILWKKISGKSVELTYRRLADNYDQTLATSVAVTDVPAVYDYPWYKIACFPDLTAYPPPVPTTQLPSALFYPAV